MTSSLARRGKPNIATAEFCAEHFDWGLNVWYPRPLMPLFEVSLNRPEQRNLLVADYKSVSAKARAAESLSL
jgi:hypothetical protein